MHVGSYGLNAQNLPYSHNNINAGNILWAVDPATQEKVVKIVNFSSAVPCANVSRGTPLNNESLLTPPE